MHYHALKHHTSEIIPERSDSAHGFEVRLSKFKSQLLRNVGVKLPHFSVPQATHL